ncbi:hypothetical protein KFV02_00100 [Desulfohalobiaceae bacterium Ax17]|jgi:hypothetical protein|uniref:hypothetical protein n=1 Tax=Desulfovulcanus ferrireducens TaxID=2831190 RepID=UPI00207BB211|nr:hypothetical protein [Desulfovulcanus ferrireducens]MBT8762333.1 hypothetical protein [Desulfovulcanus ferrireducens]
MKILLDEQERQKRAIYDSLSPRRKKFIDRIGYEKWDPFQEPNDPRKIKTDTTNRTTKQLVRDFLSECQPEDYSNAYGQGVLEICLGIVNGDDRYRAMYEFSLWYHELLKRENKEFKKSL